MSWFKSPRRQKRYEILKFEGFLSFEARVLSRQSAATPAMKTMRQERRRYLAKFEKEAWRKGWSRTKATKTYRERIRGIYHKKNWIVQEGPTGRQRGPKKGSLSPWAMYRDYVKRHPNPDEYERLRRIRKHRRRKVSIASVLDLKHRKDKRT